MFFESRNVTIKFGGLVANKDVSISIKEGQIMGLIGPNGAGKSTFFKSCNGFNTPASGEVLFMDKKISGQPTWDTCLDGVTSTFQLAETFPGITVMGTALIGAYSRAKSEKEAYDTATEVLEFMKLMDVRDKFNRELNLYTRKRVEICAVLATKPKLIEDVDGVELIKRINKERGVTVFLVEHVLKVIHELCDEVVVLDRGEVIARGTPAEVTKLPQVITAYLGEDYANA